MSKREHPLRAARKRAGLSQAELAARAKVDQSWISRAEAGQKTNPEHNKVMRVCAVLGIEPSDLFPARWAA